MIFSKSFGYAVRGVLYVAAMQEKKQYIQAEEIAQDLVVPRHFISKILKKLVKAGILCSSKGKTGGFTVNDRTTECLLSDLFELTEGKDILNKCSLRLQECNGDNPCPLHESMSHVKKYLKDTLGATTIGDLLHAGRDNLIRSIATF